MKFVPLHVYSGYTFLQSGLTIEKIQKSILTNGYFGGGLSDKHVMFGVPEFVNMMEKANRPYIVGIELEIDDNVICLYVINEEGYLNLSYISSLLEKNEFNNDILLSHKKGLIAVLDTNKGMVKEKFLDVKTSEEEFARYLLDINDMFEDFYLGIEVKSKEEINYANKLRNFALNHTYKTVAFPHIKYQKKDDAIVLTICEAISHDEVIDVKEASGQDYFMKEDDLAKIYTPREMQNTIEIVKKSSFNYHLKRGEMLHYPVTDSPKYLRDRCYASLKEKGLEDKSDYIERLEYELQVIVSMGYADYFLIVEDYVSWSRNNGILVGLRGSAAGSLVTYLLGIASLDPIKHKLQFERFLNPSRKTMPDIDIDFMDIRRGEVVDYCREKYGSDKVANIITYQTIQAKQALRDIGRIYDYPTRHIDLLSKTLTGRNMGLRDSYRHIPAFRELVDSDKYFLEIVSLASKIEGLPRQSGLHAAGVILNNEPIIDAMPVTTDLSDNLISQYEMGYLEEQGFLKMDFLGLTHLTIVDRCIELINQNHKDVHIDKFHIPYDDPKVYELICSLYTMGIFQLESSGMKNAIKTLKPSSFMDVAALLALFRPGPMDSIPSYALRKAGKEKIPYMRDEVKDILGETYGVITYQEQITELAVKMANMSMAKADNFRRAISKKKSDLLASMSKDFINGCLANGYSQKEANDYFNRFSRFASYGFNKSHAVGYALLSCQMAYLKAYYPLEFYLAILENSSNTSDTKFNEYVSEMKQRNIQMLPPDINASEVYFSLKDGAILFPLTAIKGINQLMAMNIVNVRKDGPFEDFFDFVKRMFPYKISASQLEKLIDSGAMDAFTKRAPLRSSILAALQYAEMHYGKDGQTMLSLGLSKPQINDEIDDPMENLEREYQAIGIMLSSNPLKYKKDLLNKEHTISIVEALSSLEDNNDSKPIKVAGIVRNKKVINTKKGSPMAFIKIYDETGELEGTIFPTIYKDVISITEKNNIVLLEGHFEKNKDEYSYIIDKIKLLEE